VRQVGTPRRNAHRRVLRIALAPTVLIAISVMAARGGATGLGAAPQVLATDAIAGPAASESRIAWAEPVAGTDCAHFAVRDARTLRERDPRQRFCGSDLGLDVELLTYGRRSVAWMSAAGGMSSVESIHVLGSTGYRPPPPDESMDPVLSLVGYSSSAGEEGTIVPASAGSDLALVFSVFDREYDPNCTDNCGPSDGAARLWSRQHGRWKKLPEKDPVTGLAAAGNSIALIDETTDTVEIRDVATWRLENQYAVPGVEEVALSHNFLALRTRHAVREYRRRDAKLVLTRRASNISNGDSDPEPTPLMAISDNALAYTLSIHTHQFIVVVRPDGRTTRITSASIDGLALSGRRLVWRDGKTVRLVVLPA
jgi:hypothetical protein